MADILIKNMELPKKGSVVIEIYSDEVWCDFKSPPHHGKAIELSSHGDLISKASVLSLLRYYCYMREYKKEVRCEDCENRNACVVRPIMDEVNKLDTVLEASI